MASLKSDFGGLRDHVHIEYPSQSDRITDLGRKFTKLNAKFGSALDAAAVPLRRAETLIPEFTDYVKQLEAVEARLPQAVLAWSDFFLNENIGNYELDRQPPESKVWRSLLQSFDDLEDNINNELHDLKEHINTETKQPYTKPSDDLKAGSSPLCAKFRSGTCKAGQNCKSLHIAVPDQGTFNEEYIKQVVKHWGAGLRGQNSVKEKIERINYCSVQANRADTAEIRHGNHEAVHRMATEAGLIP